MKKTKKIVSLALLLIIICVSFSSVFAHSGSLREDGGHFQKTVVGGIEYVSNYHYHQGIYAGQYVYFYPNTIIYWADRDAYYDAYAPFIP